MERILKPDNREVFALQRYILAANPLSRLSPKGCFKLRRRKAPGAGR